MELHHLPPLLRPLFLSPPSESKDRLLRLCQWGGPPGEGGETLCGSAGETMGKLVFSELSNVWGMKFIKCLPLGIFNSLKSLYLSNCELDDFFCFAFRDVVKSLQKTNKS